MRTRITILSVLWLLYSILIFSAYATESDTNKIDSILTQSEDIEESLVITLTIDGAIGTVTNDLIDIAIEEAEINVLAACGELFGKIRLSV